MSISVIGISSKSMRQVKGNSEGQFSNPQVKCKDCIKNSKNANDEVVEEPLLEKKKDMSIASLHRKVEKELKEKQKKIALLRRGVIQSPVRSRRHTCNLPNEDAENPNSRTCSDLISWIKSHLLIIICMICALVILVVIAIIVYVYVGK